MQKVDRANFVPPSSAHLAYKDISLPIVDNQTISQPFIVALMIGALDLRASDRVLEVGTGSGFQAAVLARLAREVVTVERIPSLAESAEDRLKTLGMDNVRVHLAGEELGWPEDSPYDTVVVSAAAPTLPRKLIDQLVVGGRMVAPVGSMGSQELMRVVRTADGFSVRTLGSCRFVPLIGPDAWPDSTKLIDGDQP
jgi:protein-L-isoaspartate(D-aspartate) O-methyltransferase